MNTVGQSFLERFFDILYKNEEIFSSNSEANTMFYPNVDFRELWQEEISDNTKEVFMEISSTYIIYCCKLYGQCFKFWRYCKTF